MAIKAIRNSIDSVHCTTWGKFTNTHIILKRVEQAALRKQKLTVVVPVNEAHVATEHAKLAQGASRLVAAARFTAL